MGVLQFSFFPPSAGDEYNNHPSRHGSKGTQNVCGNICFTSSGSNGSCWVVAVSFLSNLLFFFPKKVFFPCTTYAKKFSSERKSDLRVTPKEKLCDLHKKNPSLSIFLSIFPQSSCAFLVVNCHLTLVGPQLTAVLGWSVLCCLPGVPKSCSLV